MPGLIPGIALVTLGVLASTSFSARTASSGSGGPLGGVDHGADDPQDREDDAYEEQDEVAFA
jgi:hypothetical protein